MSLLLLTKDHSDTVFFLTSCADTDTDSGPVPLLMRTNAKSTRSGGMSARSYVLVPCAFAVVKKRSEATAVEVIQDCQKQALVKLKGCWELKGDKTKQIKSDNHLTPAMPVNTLGTPKEGSFSHRLIRLCCHKDRDRKSFLPGAKTLSLRPFVLSSLVFPRCRFSYCSFTHVICNL